MSYKVEIVFVDVDGTLLNSEREISDDTMKQIQELNKNNVKVVLCSGRPYRGLIKYIEMLGLNQKNQYSVSFNGGAIHSNYDGGIIHQKTFKKEELEFLTDIGLKYSVNFHIESVENIYTQFKEVGHYTIRDCFLTDMPLKVVKKDDLIHMNDICKVIFADEPEIINKLESRIPKEIRELVQFERSRPYYLEVMPKGTHKGFAVNWMKDYLSLRSSAAIGDGNNDISMFKNVDIAIAMANASNKIKEICQFTTLSNDEDGIGSAIKKWLYK